LNQILSRIANRSHWMLGLVLLGWASSSTVATVALYRPAQATAETLKVNYRDGHPRVLVAESASVEQVAMAEPVDAVAVVEEVAPAVVEEVAPAVVEEVAPVVRIPRNPEEAFIFSLVDGAQESDRITGVPASVTIAQGILESAWGRSRLSSEAHNYFGIKAQTREGTAGVVYMQTWEVENGQNVMRNEPFRRYNSAAESLIDHGYFFVENPRYARAMAEAQDPRAFARRINEAGYATDPAYAPKLISLMDKYELYQYDVN
jgi:flagellum-specific peptidoglycan hydrolase FlgJ